jgi:hypothetical protein
MVRGDEEYAARKGGERLVSETRPYHWQRPTELTPRREIGIKGDLPQRHDDAYTAEEFELM